MAEQLELTVAEVRHLLLAAQGLTGPTPQGPSAADVHAAVRRMHALQIDTISVVARSPYLVLWSRLGQYDRELLEGLVASRTVFEFWSHAACFLDAADYPYYRSIMLSQQPGTTGEELSLRARRHEEWLAENQTLVDALLERIRDGGPVRSADFARPTGETGSGWWDWKVEKVALERLFQRGDVMVTGRKNFQRLYDLRERVLPGWDDAAAPVIEEAHRALVLRVVRSLGVARAEWVAANLSWPRLGPAATRRVLSELAAAGDVVPVEVAGWRQPGFMDAGHGAALAAVREGTAPAPRTTLLSPFDPVVWDRKRALELFGFDYRIECYTPAPKRQYGYFTLPILHGGALIGRLDPKAHRTEGVMEIRALHLEPGVAVTDELVLALRETLRDFAAWHGTPEVVVRAANVAGLAEALARP